MGDELSSGQARDWYTHTHTDPQTQAMTIPEGQNWPRVKTHCGNRIDHGRPCGTEFTLVSLYSTEISPLLPVISGIQTHSGELHTGPMMDHLDVSRHKKEVHIFERRIYLIGYTLHCLFVYNEKHDTKRSVNFHKYMTRKIQVCIIYIALYIISIQIYKYTGRR